MQTKISRGQATVADIDLALQALAAIDVQIVTPPDMVRRARMIARQFNQSKIYDRNSR